MYLIQHIISPHFPNINLAVLQQFLHLFCTIHLLHCNNKDFRTLYYRGKSQVHPLLVTYVRKNRLGHPRAGILHQNRPGHRQVPL